MFLPVRSRTAPSSSLSCLVSSRQLDKAHKEQVPRRIGTCGTREPKQNESLLAQQHKRTLQYCAQSCLSVVAAMHKRTGCNRKVEYSTTIRQHPPHARYLEGTAKIDGLDMQVQKDDTPKQEPGIDSAIHQRCFLPGLVKVYAEQPSAFKGRRWGRVGARGLIRPIPKTTWNPPEGEQLAGSTELEQRATIVFPADDFRNSRMRMPAWYAVYSYCNRRVEEYHGAQFLKANQK